ncbi:hypothetical protein [Succinivibrio dextrinosolvens]|uniref:hypothetical protein n=1 Tax=Succinivibrio dextrinosolvens TaxID=83771 RepID=UPI00241EDFD7|nr:hypothetical protein [Succinivibrio dextrinosolvens]MBE6422523.1 hypothetical protein [Succinivibrio dextrinosolvens]
MASIKYFKQQAKLLLKDYNFSKEHNFDLNAVFYDAPQEHFDIKNVFLKAHKQVGEELSLMMAQHLIARISDFAKWESLIHASESQREIGALKLNAYKIGMDPSLIEEARQLVMHELVADFAVDNSGNIVYTDEDELQIWKRVLIDLIELNYY